MNAVKIKNAPLSLSQAAAISRTTFLSSNVAFRPLFQVYLASKSGNFFYIVENRKLIAWIEKYHISKKIWGLSSLYVSPAHRGSKLSEKLITASVDTINGKVLASTANPYVGDFIRKIGFKKQNNFISNNKKVFVIFLLKRYWHPIALLKIIILQYTKGEDFDYYIKS